MVVGTAENQIDTILTNHHSFKPPVEKVRLAQFLNTLYEPIYDENGESSYFIEICKIVPYMNGSYMVTESYKNCISNYDKIINRVRLFNGEHCTFFTVCPRDRKLVDRESGKTLRTSRSDVNVATVCWLDIDFDKLSEDREQAEEIAVKKISELEPFPNIIVKTPGGYHLYFLLDDTYPVEDVSYINRRMQKWTGADACGDPVRIMRIPMGWHFKEPKNRKKVEIIHFDDSYRYTIDDFAHYPVVNREVPDYERKIVLPINVPNVDISALEDSFVDQRLTKKILASNLEAYRNVYPKNSSGRRCPSRSEKDFHIICQLLKSGHTEEVIKAIFTKYPCGEKYREKERNGDKYLAHQIETAIYRIEMDSRLTYNPNKLEEGAEYV